MDIRAVVIRDNKLLMIKEKIDGKWVLPGGWADVGFTPREVVEKEVKEETGLEVQATKILAILDKKCHDHPPQPFYTYKIFIKCDLVGGKIVKQGTETLDVKFHSVSDISSLQISTNRNTLTQIEMVIEHSQNNKEITVFD